MAPSGSPHDPLRPQAGGCAEFRSLRRMSRRRILEAGSLGLLGLGLDALCGARAAATPGGAGAPTGFGRAKACIFLFMWGGPSQLDTFDPKPDAPREIRGEFRSISTAVPALSICEHFEQVAKVADRLAVVRSLTHSDPAHLSSGHATLTGHRAPVLNSDVDGPSDRDTPHLGSVVARLQQAARAVPPFVTLPWVAAHPAAPGGRAPGQNGGWLGSRYDPMLLSGDPNARDWSVPELALADDVTLGRLEGRQHLLRLVDEQRRALDNSAGAEAFKQQALGLVGSTAARQAFDLSAEPEKVRERYGRNIHGQCVLLARRLIEHGVSLVSVNWHNDGGNFWDTHGNNFRRLKKDLIPPADRALAALLIDLEERGLLDETIVAWVGEFGRKPQITRAGVGRDHWPHCYSGLLAGGGIGRGAVYGASDAHGAYPASAPVSPQDYAATIYHALGIDPELMLVDRMGRPLRVCEGRAMRALFA
ncbi:MAG: DUF1501 domain-containing protein [Planctomycetia bacterium]|nr:DUF1501 domain-containing protein [Planctomycetia bacterium]